MNRNGKVFIAGHKGLVGSAIKRKMEAFGYSNLLTRTRRELDLRDRPAVENFFRSEAPEYVILAAAKVGGILANSSHPVEFLQDNLQIQTNVISASFESGVKKLVFLGSSCIYPKFASQPMSEDELLTGVLEPTNEPYAIAKIAGIKLCEAYNREYGTNYISVMPTNLYGPNDNFDLNTSHVLPALIKKFHLAKIKKEDSVEVWGTGKPRREFLHVDDLADACLLILENYDQNNLDGIVNVGTGKDVSIYQLATTIKSIVGYKGEITFNPSKPDGTPRKLLDISKLSSVGWRPRISLEEGIATTYRWYLKSTSCN